MARSRVKWHGSDLADPRPAGGMSVKAGPGPLNLAAILTARARSCLADCGVTVAQDFLLGRIPPRRKRVIRWAVPVPGPGQSAVLKDERVERAWDAAVPGRPDKSRRPGAVDTDVSWLALPTAGLDTVAQAVPFQFMVRVCGPVV
jgi:hypothetical protein